MDSMLTKEEFLSLMEEFDCELSNRGVPIASRPGNVFSLFCKKYHFSASMGSCKGETVEGYYSTNNIGSQIDRWYNEQYGQRMIGSVQNGEFVILIRGNSWKVRVPIVFGKRALGLKNYIVDMTNDFADKLNEEEVKEIMSNSKKFFSILQELSCLPHRKFILEAKNDYNVSVYTLMCPSPLSALSKWHSLQFVEKLIKFYLFESGIVPDVKKMNKGHKLSDYNKLAASDGIFEEINIDLLDRIQCSADVRYDQKSITLNQAVDAHHASLEVCSHIMSQSKKRFCESTL